MLLRPPPPPPGGRRPSTESKKTVNLLDLDNNAHGEENPAIDMSSSDQPEKDIQSNKYMAVQKQSKPNNLVLVSDNQQAEIAEGGPMNQDQSSTSISFGETKERSKKAAGRPEEVDLLDLAFSPKAGQMSQQSIDTLPANPFADTNSKQVKSQTVGDEDDVDFLASQLEGELIAAVPDSQQQIHHQNTSDDRKDSRIAKQDLSIDSSAEAALKRKWSISDLLARSPRVTPRGAAPKSLGAGNPWDDLACETVQSGAEESDPEHGQQDDEKSDTETEDEDENESKATKSSSKLNEGRDEPSIVSHGAASQNSNKQKEAKSTEGKSQVGALEVSKYLQDTSLAGMKEFLCSPLPKNGGVLTCYVIRNRAGFALYNEADHRFLLAARKAPRIRAGLGASYLITMRQEDYDLKSACYLGRLNGTFTGAEYSLYDNGLAPGKAEGILTLRRQLVTINYATTRLQGIPRHMTVCIPKVSQKGSSQEYEAAVWKPRTKREGMQKQVAQGKKDGIEVILNKPPVWNELLESYCLDFGGRVTEACVSNFLLSSPSDPDEVVMLFGQAATNRFSCDVKFPLSPLQAFGIALSSLSSKLVCE